MDNIMIQPIAKMQSDFRSKFGIPRQSGLVEELTSTIVFEPEYRNADMLRGIDGYSHLWLIWQFSENASQKWSPTVRPPRLGGNTRRTNYTIWNGTAYQRRRPDERDTHIRY